MRIRAGVLVLIFAFTMAFMPAAAGAAERFGVIFDIQGNTTLEQADGKTITLSKSSHILRSVAMGEKITVKGQGRVLVVSTSSKKGYIVSSDSTAVVEADGMVALTGKVETQDGLNAPSGGAKGAIGAIVLRSSRPGHHCLKPVTPVDTAVIVASPRLQWENNCKGSPGVGIKVLKNRRIVFQKAVTDLDYIDIPADVLEDSASYRWLIDGGKEGLIGSTFSTLGAEVRKIIDENIQSYNSESASLPERLSHLFLLLDNDLNEMAETEIASLEKDFPNNPNIQALR